MRIESSSTFVSTSNVSNNENNPSIKSSIEKVGFDKTYSQEKQIEEVSKDGLQNAVDSINKFLEPTYTSMKFNLHDKSGEYFVQIVDSNTSEVIREVPSKRLLDIYAAMKEILGLVVDKKI